MVGDTGLEPASQGGQEEDTSRTKHVRSGESPYSKGVSQGQMEDNGGHVGDTLARSPCCTYVAGLGLPEDLARVVETWQILPTHIRRAVLTLVNGTVATTR